MKKIRIGISPYSANLSHPGDRRRIVSWARNRGHEIIVGESNKVDVLFISEGSDFLRLSKVKGPPKIFDLIDGYLAPQNSFHDMLRGFSKSLIRQHKTYPRSYTSIVRETCRNVELVVCSSPEQMETIRPYNTNIHIILDNHSEFPFRSFQDARNRESSGLFWEGTTYTLAGVEELLSALSDSNMHINIVTDLLHSRLLGHYFKQDVSVRLAHSLRSTRFNLFPWSIENVVHKSANSKVAIIPVYTRDKLQIMKPENRLLIMFRLGIPCLTSSIPSYERIEQVLQTKITCKGIYDWKYSISRLLADDECAADQVNKGQEYLRKFHSEEILFDKWDNAVRGIL
jgi:hypothetical protein